MENTRSVAFWFIPRLEAHRWYFLSTKAEFVNFNLFWVFFSYYWFINDEQVIIFIFRWSTVHGDGLIDALSAQSRGPEAFKFLYVVIFVLYICCIYKLRLFTFTLLTCMSCVRSFCTISISGRGNLNKNNAPLIFVLTYILLRILSRKKCFTPIPYFLEAEFDNIFRAVKTPVDDRYLLDDPRPLGDNLCFRKFFWSK